MFSSFRRACIKYFLGVDRLGMILDSWVIILLDSDAEGLASRSDCESIAGSVGSQYVAGCSHEGEP